MHSRVLLASGFAIMLSACSGGIDTGHGAGAEAGWPVAAPELIPRDALFGNPERTNVRISPDGRYLSWLAPVDGILNIWVAPAADPSQARAVTGNRARSFRDYFWSHRPDTLLYLRDTGGDEDFHLFSVDLSSGKTTNLSPFPGIQAQLFGISAVHPESVLVGMNDRDPQWHDLYRVDLSTGKRTLLQRNTRRIGVYITDADYRLRYAIQPGPDGGYNLLAADAAEGWRLADEIPFEDALSTHPLGGLTTDGKTLYMVDSRGRDTSALFAVDTASGDRRLIYEDDRADVGNALFHPRTGNVQAVLVKYLREEWSSLDDRIAADLERLEALGPGDATVASRTHDDSVWIVAYSAAEAPLTYYRYDRGDGGTLTKLFETRPALAGKPLVPMWPQEIRSRDGRTLVSYLTLPHEADPDRDGKADRPVPMVLMVHGGPWARDSYGYDANGQWLANRGYAVLQVNFRGSTGFGKEFTNAGNGEWGARMQDDLLDGVQWAVDQGVTTVDQVAIMGRSYGGYATLAGLAFTPDAFKCGVDIVGPSNLITVLGTVPPYWARYFEQMARRIGDPRTEAGRLLLAERSPLTHADRISKPLLIGQGANDPRVKRAESDQIVRAMTAKGIPVTYVLFPDEGHGFQRPENSKAFNAVVEGFLSQCLGGRAQPIGGDLARSSIEVPNGIGGVPGLAEAMASHEQVIRK